MKSVQKQCIKQELKGRNCMGIHVYRLTNSCCCQYSITYMHIINYVTLNSRNKHKYGECMHNHI